jgi:hypothetical protein
VNCENNLETDQESGIDLEIDQIESVQIRSIGKIDQMENEKVEMIKTKEIKRDAW